MSQLRPERPMHVPEVTQELNVRTTFQTLAQKPASLWCLGGRTERLLRMQTLLQPWVRTDQAFDHRHTMCAASPSLRVLIYKMGIVK